MSNWVLRVKPDEEYSFSNLQFNTNTLKDRTTHINNFRMIGAHTGNIFEHR